MEENRIERIRRLIEEISVNVNDIRLERVSYEKTSFSLKSERGAEKEAKLKAEGYRIIAATGDFITMEREAKLRVFVQDVEIEDAQDVLQYMYATRRCTQSFMDRVRQDLLSGRLVICKLNHEICWREDLQRMYDAEYESFKEEFEAGCEEHAAAELAAESE